MKNREHRGRLGNGQRAYTLLELLITVAIITILAALSLPDLHSAEQKEAEQVFLQLGAVISGARAVAINRHVTVVVCPAINRNVCHNKWDTGVLAFIDSNQNRQLDPSESIIEHQTWGGTTPASTGKLRGSLIWRVFGNRQSIRISELGELSDQNGSLTWCPPTGSPVSAHQMVLNNSGRIRLATDQNGDGLREDSQGKTLTC